MSHNHQKKIAVINDLSGFGRCSLTVSIPVISYMGIQCCPVLTSILSNHTGFCEFFFDDYTKHMQAYIDQWKKLDLKFSGIMTGFMASSEQIHITERFIRDFREKDTIVVIDPAMGEHGIPYTTYTDAMCMEMKRLVQYADIITPNLTEACILTGVSYHKGSWSESELFRMAERLIGQGAKKVVITGLDWNNQVGNVVCEQGTSPRMLVHQKSGEFRSGTGDLFASILACDAVHGVSIEESVLKAGEFVNKAIEATQRLQIPETDGLAFEEVLYQLKRF